MAILKTDKAFGAKAKTATTVVMAAAIAVSSVGLTACQTTKNVLGKRDDGSLDYQQSEKLEPIQLPADQETQRFVPLYPTPQMGANTLELSNEAGKQFELPPPQRAVSSAATGNVQEAQQSQ